MTTAYGVLEFVHVATRLCLPVLSVVFMYSLCILNARFAGAGSGYVCMTGHNRQTRLCFTVKVYFDF